MAVSWKAVKMATFRDGVSANTDLSVWSLGSGACFRLCKRSAISARAFRSLRTSARNRSLSKSAGVPASGVGQRVVNQVRTQERIVLSGSANQIPDDIGRGDRSVLGDNLE